jgi:hypothetical protein
LTWLDDLANHPPQSEHKQSAISNQQSATAKATAKANGKKLKA